MKLVKVLELHFTDVYSNLHLMNEEHKINKQSHVEN